MIDKRIKKVLITSEEVNEGITKAADWLNNIYAKIPANEPIIIIGILKGCIPFIGKLFNLLTFDTKLDFMCISTYDGDYKSNNLKIITDLKTNILNHHVIILEDIIDSGITIAKIIELLSTKQPKSIKIVALLNKDVPKISNINIDYVCFVVPNKFLVGFGLDYKEILRNIPYIGILDPKYY